MSRFLDQIQSALPANYFTDLELLNLVKGSAHARYGLIKRAIAQGELVHLRRGLYLLGEKYRRQSLNLFELAQKIYGPSYISFESALSQRGWIPEAVYSVTSASFNRSKKFQNVLGLFSYQRVIAKPFFVQVERVQTKTVSYFLASPWRAVADYVYVHKKDWQGLHPLIHSLRIDDEHFEKVNRSDLEEIEQAYHHRRITKFIQGALKELA